MKLISGDGRDDVISPGTTCYRGLSFRLMILAGTPTAVTWGGRSSMTTAPAPTVVYAPIDTLSITVAPAPM